MMGKSTPGQRQCTSSSGHALLTGAAMPCLVKWVHACNPRHRPAQLICEQVTTSVNNMVTGNYFVAHRGSLEVKQASTGRLAVIKFKEPGLTTMSTKGRKTANRPVSASPRALSMITSAPVSSDGGQG